MWQNAIDQEEYISLSLQLWKLESLLDLTSLAFFKRVCLLTYLYAALCNESVCHRSFGYTIVLNVNLLELCACACVCYLQPKEPLLVFPVNMCTVSSVFKNFFVFWTSVVA